MVINLKTECLYVYVCLPCIHVLKSEQKLGSIFFMDRFFYNTMSTSITASGLIMSFTEMFS